ncbi:MAG TPA: glycosyltransferase family 39 protein, partial [Gemmatales bacterium]|nr:glycosyltransferase family 39 protein [Gemmatales bacterium]
MQKSLALAALVLMLYLLCFHRLGARELWSSHEARAAQEAQTILEGADWRLPRLFDGRLELQKPPLYYWLTALLAKVWGQVDEVSVRLPAVLGFLFTGLAVFTLLWQQGLQRAAWLGMIALWTMLHFTWMSRVGRIDMPLTAACSWCIVSMVLGSQRSGWASTGWLLAGYLCLAAGLMLKGPIAAVLC